MKPVIHLDQVSKQFKGKTAVDRLSLMIEEGSVVALLGPNGAEAKNRIEAISIAEKNGWLK